jgi:hypothetical protein
MMARTAALSGGGSDGQTPMIFTKLESWCVLRCVGVVFTQCSSVSEVGSKPAARTMFHAGFVMQTHK